MQKSIDQSGATVSVENLRSTCDDLRISFGADRFDRILSTFKPSEARGLPAYQLEKAKAHPMAVEWHELMQAVTNSEAAGKLLLPERSFFLLDHLFRLREVRNVKGIERILRKLENSSEYYSTLFEIRTLSFYWQNGAQIEVVPESKVQGQRTPDFLVRCKDLDCYIECKSLEDLSKREEFLWDQIEGRIVKLLDKHKKSWRILIRPQRVLRGLDINNLMSLVTQRVKDDLLGCIRSSDNSIQLEFRRYTVFPEMWAPGDHNAIRREYSRTCLQCEIQTDENGNTFHRNVSIVDVEPFVEMEETQRILDDINDAHGQIPAGACGVLHIEIPFRMTTRLLEVCDRAFQRAFGLLRKKPRIDAVVLSAQSLDPRPKDGGNVVVPYCAVIPSPCPALELPDDFTIMGASTGPGMPFKRATITDSMKFFWKTLKLRFSGIPFPKMLKSHSELHKYKLGPEASIFVQFAINEPLTSQVGKSLIDFCSHNGKSQVRAWQSYSNHFRVDIVHPLYGRRTFKSDENSLAIGIDHKLMMTWSKDGISVAIDGRILDSLA